MKRLLFTIFLLFVFYGQAQLIDSFRFVESDYALSLGPAVYCTQADIVPQSPQGATVTEWTDISGNNKDFTDIVGSPEVDLNGTEGVAINFGSGIDAVETMGLTDATVGDYIIGTDEFTVIARAGADDLQNGIIFGKRQGVAGEANWYLQVESDGELRVNTGGNDNSNITGTHGAYSLYILVVDTTNYTLYVDGTQLSTGSVGTDNTSTGTRGISIHLGGSHTNGQSVEGEMDLFILYDFAIDATERGNIETQYKVN